MNSFAIGDKVTEPQHGFATVTFVGTERIGLRFEQSGQQVLFRLGDCDLHRGWDESVLLKGEANREVPPLPWPDDLRRRDSRCAPFHGKKPNRLVSFYPYADHGTQTHLQLERVRVWESGVEAQIDACWGDASITFFDTAFLVSRCWCEAGGDYDALLAGVAYAAHPAKEERIPFTPHPDQLAWERMLAEYRGEPAPETLEYIGFSGSAFLLGLPDWDADDYSFRGRVKGADAFDDFLGQAG